MERHRMKIISALLAIVIPLAVLAGCGGGSGPASSQPAAGQTGANAANARAAGQQKPGVRVSAIPVQAVTILIGPLKTSNDTAGTVVPVTLSSVASQVSGVVSAVPRLAGDWVKAGATVVQLDDSQLRLAVQNAQ